MGLPPEYVDRTGPWLLAGLQDLAGAGPAELQTAAESPTVPFLRRLGAATMLGLLGDPRVQDPLTPQMIDVPGGTMEFGLREDAVDGVVREWSHVGVIRSWIEKECPAQPVPVNGFRMARFPVTNYEYRMFLLDTALEDLPSSWPLGVYTPHLSNHPVHTVTAEAADAYAAWLAQRTGRRFRLPTEVEWEYAASGGDGREFPWGDAFDPNATNTVEAGPLMTTPIGVYPDGRSPFGMDDMGGNVEEYVADDFAPYPGGPSTQDDLAQAHGAYRIARGGSFGRFGDLTRCRRRHGWYDRAFYSVGFRVAETP